MAVDIRPFVVAVNHVEGCAKRKCGPECKRTVDGLEVDIVVLRPSGETIRERRKFSGSRTAAWRWGEERQNFLITHGKERKKEVPTLEQFVPRYLEEYARAKRQKPSTIAHKESVIEYYLKPRFGGLALDRIDDACISRLEADMVEKSPKTTNNVLCVLSTILKAALKWKVIDCLPCTSNC